MIDKIAWIEIQNEKILSTRSRGKSTYYIPGGKREKGETDQETLVREIREELSVEIIPESISYMDGFQAQADGHKEGVVVKMTCYKAGYTGKLVASHEIEELKWLRFEDLEIISPVDKLIFRFLYDKGELK